MASRTFDPDDFARLDKLWGWKLREGVLMDTGEVVRVAPHPSWPGRLVELASDAQAHYVVMPVLDSAAYPISLDTPLRRELSTNENFPFWRIGCGEQPFYTDSRIGPTGCAAIENLRKVQRLTGWSNEYLRWNWLNFASEEFWHAYSFFDVEYVSIAFLGMAALWVVDRLREGV